MFVYRRVHISDTQGIGATPGCHLTGCKDDRWNPFGFPDVPRYQVLVVDLSHYVGYDSIS